MNPIHNDPAWASNARGQWQKLQTDADKRVWISLTDKEQFEAQIAALGKRKAAGDTLPLLGQTFAVKDNIDAVGLPTTAGCPNYAYSPAEDATVVARLKNAGAILLGKTSLDQFATGLVGTRSPHGACPNAINPDFISGGSSSGSAVAVARGEVDFSVGTDTAGSGRVPAALNGLIGYKPTCGTISTRGVVPACRSLDCISIFAKSPSHAARLAAVARGFDAAEPYSRPFVGHGPCRATGVFRFGVPRENQLQFFGDAHAPALFQQAVAKLKSIGGEAIEVDFSPFSDASALLYEGPWVAERYAAVGEWIEKNQDACDPTVAKIILAAKSGSAAETFRAMYRLKALQSSVSAVWTQIDCLVVPTAPALYRIAEVTSNPTQLNSNLGFYNNFVNLLDLAAVVVPVGHWPSGVSFGATLIGPAFADDTLLNLAARCLGQEPPTPTTPNTIRLAVVGAHLRGQPLHHQLTTLNAEFVTQTTTTPNYRLHALVGTVPPKPGLARVAENGAAIELEVYALTAEAFGKFVAAIPPPLGIGSVELADGSWGKGFLCEPIGLQGAPDISHFGGWRGYLASTTK